MSVPRGPNGAKRAADATNRRPRRLAAGLLLGVLALVGLAVLAERRRVSVAEEQGGRVLLTLPLELELTDGRESLAGGTLLETWLEVPDRVASLLVYVFAGGQECPQGPEGFPQVSVELDGVVVENFVIEPPLLEHRLYRSQPLTVAPGVRRLLLRFSNDYYEDESCDRNVSVRRLLVTASALQAAAGARP
jgi:hypothetical protein